MKYDESSISRDKLGLDKLNRVLGQIIENLEKSREEIFIILQEYNRQCMLAEREKEDLPAKPGLDIKRQKLLLDEQAAKFRIAAKKAERLLINTGLAIKIIEANEIIWEAPGLDYSVGPQMLKIESRELERNRIAREIHDGPAQILASMLMNLDLIEQEGLNDINKVYKGLKNTKEMVVKCLLELRQVLYDLNPVFLREGPFSEILKEFFKDYYARHSFNINFISSGDIDSLDYSFRIVLFRLIQEAVNNARKHSRVNEAVVKIENDGRFITLIIKDEGVGFNFSKTKDTYGISGMEERAEIIDGEIQIVSSPGVGTKIIIKAPLEREDRQYEKD